MSNTIRGNAANVEKVGIRVKVEQWIPRTISVSRSLFHALNNGLPFSFPASVNRESLGDGVRGELLLRYYCLPADEVRDSYLELVGLRVPSIPVISFF